MLLKLEKYYRDCNIGKDVALSHWGVGYEPEARAGFVAKLSKVFNP